MVAWVAVLGLPIGTSLIVARDWRVHSADIRIDGALVFSLVRGAASLEIRVDPRGFGRRALVQTPWGDVSYSSVHGLAEPEAAEVTRLLANELDGTSLERAWAAWPHLALPPVQAPPEARSIGQSEIADWLGLCTGAQLDDWQLRGIREKAGGPGITLSIEHVTTTERATIAIAAATEHEQAFAAVGPWTVIPLSDSPGKNPSRATLRLCSRLATLVADRMAADPVVPETSTGLHADSTHALDATSMAVPEVLRKCGLPVVAVRRNASELGIVLRGPLGDTTLKVARRRGRISSFRNGRHLAVIPDRGPVRQAGWIAEACDTLLDAEPALLDALGGSETDEIETGRLIPASTNPGAGFVVAREHTAVLLLTSPCLADCVFCGQETTRRFTLEPIEDVLEGLRRDAPLYERVLVVGFEPLTHPGVVAMIETCREAGVREVELMTSGVALATAGSVRALVDAGLTHVAVPVYAPDAATNDLIMRRAGAFELTVRALDSVAGAGIEVFVHSLLLAGALEGIDRLQAVAKQRWGARFAAAAPRSKSSYSEIAPAYSDVNAAVHEAPVIGMPLCLVPRMLAHPDLEPGRPLQLTLRELAESMRSYFMQGLVYPEACRGCAARRACTGVLADQLLLEPQLPLAPVASLPSARNA